MLKPLIYAVNCDKSGKLVSLENCIKCRFYLGKKSNQMECMFDKEAYKENIKQQYKNYYIEFGDKNE